MSAKLTSFINCSPRSSLGSLPALLARGGRPDSCGPAPSARPLPPGRARYARAGCARLCVTLFLAGCAKEVPPESRVVLEIAGRPVTVDGVPVLEMGMNNAQDFSGNGAATQSNKLDGFITVTVHKRLSNGNLLVRGQKWVGINSGREYVRLQGIVRPSDIAPDNSVLSWRVADAYISYGGQGTVANASKPGWLYRFFNSPKTPF